MDLDHLVPDKGALLARHEFFRGVSSEVMRKLTAHARLIGYPIGATIFTKGHPGLGLLAVVSGLVRISVPAKGGREVVLRLVGANEVFGEIALLDGGPRTAVSASPDERAGGGHQLRRPAEAARQGPAPASRGPRSRTGCAAENYDHPKGARADHRTLAGEHEQVAARLGNDRSHFAREGGLHDRPRLSNYARDRRILRVLPRSSHAVGTPSASHCHPPSGSGKGGGRSRVASGVKANSRIGTRKHRRCRWGTRC